MKVVVVGCGWLGSQLAQQLANDGHQVAASRRTAEAAGTLPVNVLSLVLDLSDVPDTTKLQPLFADAIVVCAVAPGIRSGQSHYVEALQQLARIIITSGSRQVIHFSSSGIYQGLSGVVDETAALQEADARVSILLQGEQALQQFEPTVTLRLAGLMGPGRHPGRFTAGKQLPDADGPVNMIHAWDVISAVKLVMAASPCRGLYNLSSPETETRRTFYHTAALLAGQQSASFSDVTTTRKVAAGKFMQQFSFQYQFINASTALAYCD